MGEDVKNLRRETLKEAIKRAQKLVREYIPPERSLVDDLLEERRREALLE